MTEPNPADVTQEDRKWAHYMLLAANKVHPTHEAAILAGEWDNTDEVQFIVRHRIAALQQSRSAVEALKAAKPIVDNAARLAQTAFNICGSNTVIERYTLNAATLIDAALSQESADA